MKKTFKIEDRLGRLTDSRINPSHSTSEGIVSVLLGFLVRIQSFNELKYRLKSKDFKGIISRTMRLPQIHTIREVLKKIDLAGLRELSVNIVKKAKQNKVLKNITIDGYTVAARDGGGVTMPIFTYRG